MQVLWKEVFEGNRPLIVDEFLSSGISQSLCFYQFYASGSDCRMIRSLPTFDREWKEEFFFVSGPWASDLVEVGRDTFPLLVGNWGCLCLEGMQPFFDSSKYSFLPIFNFSFLFAAVTCPSLNNTLLDKVQ